MNKINNKSIMSSIIEAILTSLYSLLLIVFSSLFYGLLIWPCWNIVMPLFGLERITYIGACSLFVLFKILFSTFNIKL